MILTYIATNDDKCSNYFLKFCNGFHMLEKIGQSYTLNSDQKWFSHSEVFTKNIVFYTLKISFIN